MNSVPEEVKVDHKRLMMIGQRGEQPRSLDDRFLEGWQPLSWTLETAERQFAGEVVVLPSLSSLPAGVAALRRRLSFTQMPLGTALFSGDAVEKATFSVDLSGDLFPHERLRDRSLVMLTWSGAFAIEPIVDEDLPEWAGHLLKRQEHPMLGVAQWGADQGYGRPVTVEDDPKHLDLRILRRGYGVLVSIVPTFQVGSRGTLVREAFVSRLVTVHYGFEGSRLEVKVTAKVHKGYQPKVWTGQDAPDGCEGVLRRAQNYFHSTARLSPLQRAQGPRRLRRAALPARLRTAG